MARLTEEGKRLWLIAYRWAVGRDFPAERWEELDGEVASYWPGDLPHSIGFSESALWLEAAETGAAGRLELSRAGEMVHTVIAHLPTDDGKLMEFWHVEKVPDRLHG